jgi:hypothetical protein
MVTSHRHQRFLPINAFWKNMADFPVGRTFLYQRFSFPDASLSPWKSGGSRPQPKVGVQNPGAPLLRLPRSGKSL